MAENIFPYNLPKNWHWTTLENLILEKEDFFDGDWILKENMTPKGSIRLLQLADIGTGIFLNKSNKRIDQKTFNDLKCKEVKSGDILIARMPEPIARSCIVPKLPDKLITAVDVAVLRCNPFIVLNSYINYLCNSEFFTKVALNKARGTTRLRITRKNLGEIPIPLPPIEEQKKIVERIESLFSKLDSAKSIVQKILDGYELRRSAILHKAFTGELTKNFRAENNLSLDDWQEKTLGEVSDVRDGTHDSPEFYDSGFPLITSKNLKNGLITGDGIKYICQSDYEKINLRSKVDVGDILFAMIGTIGNPIVISEEPNFAIKNVALFKDLKKIDMKFLKFFLESYCTTKKMKLDAKGTTQKFLPLNYLRNFPVVSPSLAEQKEIVRVLDGLLDKEQRTKEIAEKILQEIDLLKKSVLARAFRGEL